MDSKSLAKFITSIMVGGIIIIIAGFSMPLAMGMLTFLIVDLLTGGNRA